MGWALKRERKNCRFDYEVRDYFQEVFELGEQTGKKFSAHDVSGNMLVVRDVKGVKIFQSDQYLQPSQISSFSPGCQYWLVPQKKKSLIMMI